MNATKFVGRGIGALPGLGWEKLFHNLLATVHCLFDDEGVFHKERRVHESLRHTPDERIWVVPTR
jgi:hypothetical protein